MAYVLQKAAEEVTERALVPYVVQPVVESGFSTMLIKWLPWSGVAIHSAGIYKEVSYGRTYSGGITWLVKRIVYWCFPQSYGVLITARCLSFISGVIATAYSGGLTLPLVLSATLGSFRSLLRD